MADSSVCTCCSNVVTAWLGSACDRAAARRSQWANSASDCNTNPCAAVPALGKVRANSCASAADPDWIATSNPSSKHVTATCAGCRAEASATCGPSSGSTCSKPLSWPAFSISVRCSGFISSCNESRYGVRYRMTLRKPPVNRVPDPISSNSIRFHPIRCSDSVERSWAGPFQNQ